MEPGGLSFLPAECKIHGFDHAEIVSDICEKWRIAEHIITAIRISIIQGQPETAWQIYFMWQIWLK
jgi:hypothetical protein